MPQRLTDNRSRDSIAKERCCDIVPEKMRSAPVTFFLPYGSGFIDLDCLVPDSAGSKRIVRINRTKKQVIIAAFRPFIHEIIIDGIPNGCRKRKDKRLASLLLREMYLVSIPVNETLA